MRQSIWTLSTCLRQLPRPLSLRGIRLQTTGKIHLIKLFTKSTFSSFTAAAADGAISPALLSRARSMAKEYQDINTKLAENFDTNAAKKLGQLTSVNNALQVW
jgi:peptide chain release factor 1